MLTPTTVVISSSPAAMDVAGGIRHRERLEGIDPLYV